MDEHSQGILSHYQGSFFNFQKILLPATCFPDTSPDIPMHPKTIVSTSHQNFSKSIKIAAENSQPVPSPVIRTISHMSTSTKVSKNSQTIFKNSKSNPTQLYNKLEFNIFYVVQNFGNISSMVKIVKKTHAGKKDLYLRKSRSSHLKVRQSRQSPINP